MPLQIALKMFEGVSGFVYRERKVVKWEFKESLSILQVNTKDALVPILSNG